MIPNVVHILPRMNVINEINGWRACAASVPGCVVIHQDHNHALDLVTTAVKAIIEEDFTNNAN